MRRCPAGTPRSTAPASWPTCRARPASTSTASARYTACRCPSCRWGRTTSRQSSAEDRSLNRRRVMRRCLVFLAALLSLLTPRPLWGVQAPAQNAADKKFKEGDTFFQQVQAVQKQRFQVQGLNFQTQLEYVIVSRFTIKKVHPNGALEVQQKIEAV